MPRMTFYVFDLEGSRETLGGYRFGGNTDSRRRPHPLVAQFKRRGTLGRGTPVDPPPLRAFVCRPPAPGAVFQADARECRAGGLGRENTPGTRPSRDPGLRTKSEGTARFRLGSNPPERTRENGVLPRR